MVNSVCVVCGGKFSSHFAGNPYCNKHYQSMHAYGQPNGKPRRSTNTFNISENILIITTKKGDTILADAEDYEMLQKYSWCISKTGYAVACIQKRVRKMHRCILANKLNDGDIIDHANGDPLDNRKTNLRICTPAENGKNISVKSSNKLGVKGVRLTKNGTYNVRLVVDGKEIHVGNFRTLEAAISAHTEAERKYHGAYAMSYRPQKEKMEHVSKESRK